jgi:hypothetical protein
MLLGSVRIRLCFRLPTGDCLTVTLGADDIAFASTSRQKRALGADDGLSDISFESWLDHAFTL